MKDNLTEIVAIIDASGSMQPFVNDTIGGFNKFLEEQKTLDGEANITLITFDSENPHNVIFDGINIKNCSGLNHMLYKAGGMTPLYDAIGRTINSVGSRLASIPESERPSKVLFLISTDGEENSSREFTQEMIKNLIEHQNTKYNWEFVFTAANIDTQKYSSGIGISGNMSASYNQMNTQALYTDTFSMAATSYRATGKVSLNSQNVVDNQTNLS